MRTLTIIPPLASFRLSSRKRRNKTTFASVVIPPIGREKPGSNVTKANQTRTCGIAKTDAGNSSEHSAHGAYLGANSMTIKNITIMLPLPPVSPGLSGPTFGGICMPSESLAGLCFIPTPIALLTVVRWIRSQSDRNLDNGELKRRTPSVPISSAPVSLAKNCTPLKRKTVRTRRQAKASG